MGVKIRIKNGHYYLDVIKNRVHHWESLHLEVSEDPALRKQNKALAERCRANRETQLLNGEWGFQDSISGKKTLLQYAREKAAGKDKRKSGFWRVLRYLEKYREGEIRLSSITAEWVDGFQKYLLAKPGLSLATASQYSGIIRQILNMAVKERILASNPAGAVKSIPAPETNKKALSFEELQAIAAVDISIFGNTGKEARNAFLFSCLCGLRLSDIRTLVWGDIEARQINKYNRFKYWIKKRQVKTGHYVDIPISDNAWLLIGPRGLPQNPVFPALAKIRQGHTIGRYIRMLAKKAGIEWQVTFHTSRRTFATLELESGADPFTVQKLMGHSNITMTGVYAKSDRIKSGAVAALDNALDGLGTAEKMA